MSSNPEKQIEEFLSKASFNLLKYSLLSFIKLNFKPCDDFVNQMINCEDDSSLKKLFVRYSDEVYEKLGGDPNLDDEINDLEREGDKLRRKITTLEDRISVLELGTTLNDEYKQTFFIQLHGQYDPWEIEDLLKNGKKYLDT